MRRAQAEAARVEAVKARRDAERRRAIEDEIHIASVSATLKEMGQDPTSKSREELLKLTTEGLEAEAAEKEAKAAKAAENKHFKKEQELSFLTRALREQEQDALAAWIDARLQADGEYATAQQAAVKERARKLHAETLRVKQRLERMMQHLDGFEATILAKREEEHALALVRAAPPPPFPRRSLCPVPVSVLRTARVTWRALPPWARRAP